MRDTLGLEILPVVFYTTRATNSSLLGWFHSNVLNTNLNTFLKYCISIKEVLLYKSCVPPCKKKKKKAPKQYLR